MMVWQIRYAFHGSNACESLLQDGWEPFAVTGMNKEGNTGDGRVWFRKMVEK